MGGGGGGGLANKGYVYTLDGGGAVLRFRNTEPKKKTRRRVDDEKTSRFTRYLLKWPFTRSNGNTTEYIPPSISIYYRTYTLVYRKTQRSNARRVGGGQ